MTDRPTLRSQVTVRRWDLYGTRVIRHTPATILAADRAELTAKVRDMFGATYDDFRKFWSHDHQVIRADEEPS